ncbi:proline-rich protein 2-like [Penaeus monodon]|uniref:proline-rich protein 2-like n=1 Tax=Penaeus monodon TaxID=6687 RepID=UPI0018A79592|nr:proline-rich protein 2-like [Penaeus monodon]
MKTIDGFNRKSSRKNDNPSRSQNAVTKQHGPHNLKFSVVSQVGAPSGPQPCPPSLGQRGPLVFPVRLHRYLNTRHKPVGNHKPPTKTPPKGKRAPVKPQKGLSLNFQSPKQDHIPPISPSRTEKQQKSPTRTASPLPTKGGGPPGPPLISENSPSTPPTRKVEKGPNGGSSTDTTFPRGPPAFRQNSPEAKKSGNFCPKGKNCNIRVAL